MASAKSTDKIYYRHSSCPEASRPASRDEPFQARWKKAVKGMLPKAPGQFS
jgi:ribosomal protein L13